MGIYDSVKNDNLITIQKGSTCNVSVTIKDEDGVVIDLTGYTTRAQLKTLAGATVGTFDITVSAPTTGVVDMQLISSVTTLLTVSDYVQHVWGLELTQPSGDIYPEIQGGAIIDPEVVT